MPNFNSESTNLCLTEGMLGVLWWDSEWQRQMATEMIFFSYFNISFHILFEFISFFLSNRLCHGHSVEKNVPFFLNHPHFFIFYQAKTSFIHLLKYFCNKYSKSTRLHSLSFATHINQRNIWLINNWKIEAVMRKKNRVNWNSLNSEPFMELIKERKKKMPWLPR